MSSDIERCHKHGCKMMFENDRLFCPQCEPEFDKTVYEGLRDAGYILRTVVECAEQVLWDKLFSGSERVLKDGGFLVTFCGQYKMDAMVKERDTLKSQRATLRAWIERLLAQKPDENFTWMTQETYDEGLQVLKETAE